MPEPLGADHERTALDLLLKGFQVSRMLRVVADLGVADRIAPDGRVALDDLAAACGVHSQPLLRVLQALASFGVFSVTAEGSVAHTPRSRLLRTDAPNSLHHAARFWTAPGSWRAWEELDAAMTGGVPHEAAWGQGRFAYLREHPEEARLFDAMMANFPDNRHAALAAAYDFSGARLICDVGGGNGAALRHILGRFPLAAWLGVRPGGRCARHPAGGADGGADRGGGRAAPSTAFPPVRTSTCWCASSTTGTTRTACASSAFAALPWARRRGCCSANRSSSPIRHAADRPAISSTRR